MKLQFFAPTVKVGKKYVVIPMSILDQGISLWDDCLTSQFFGLHPKLDFIQYVVDNLWGRTGKVVIIPLDGDGFMFKFSDPKTMS